jgi:hypothetical protein
MRNGFNRRNLRSVEIKGLNRMRIDRLAKYEDTGNLPADGNCCDAQKLWMTHGMSRSLKGNNRLA